MQKWLVCVQMEREVYNFVLQFWKVVFQQGSTCSSNGVTLVNFTVKLYIERRNWFYEQNFAQKVIRLSKEHMRQVVH